MEAASTEVATDDAEAIVNHALVHGVALLTSF